MRLIGKIALGLLVVLVIAIAGFAAFVASRQNLKFDAPDPPITASQDSAVLARGRYVVRDVAVCASCHAAPGNEKAVLAGEEVPLSGGYVFDIPPGKFFTRNITPDPETGIGGMSPGTIARSLRFGVGHDGRALLPFMEFQGLSDEDLTAVVSYLKAQAPVRNPVPDHEYTLLGRIVRATMLSQPIQPKSTPPTTSPRGPTVENGAYLAGSVANCYACHTQRDVRTGELTNELYSGAKTFESEGKIWAAPNLTPDPKTGVTARLTEDQFVARIRAGRAIEGSPMPWASYQRMSDDDLRAIYRFLKTLPPVENDVGPALVQAH